MSFDDLHWRREEPSGRKITQEKGERYTRWLRSQPDRRLHLGATVRSVSYADHRSGWHAIVFELDLIWWSYAWVIFKWQTKHEPPVTLITLSEQIRAVHGQVEADPVHVDVFDKRLKEKAIKRNAARDTTWPIEEESDG